MPFSPNSHQINWLTYFNSLNGYFVRILNHLRLGLSDLRDHLFSFNLSDNPICPLCNNEFKSTHHFLFSCSSVKVLSESYLTDLSILVPNFKSIDQVILMNMFIWNERGQFEYKQIHVIHDYEVFKSYLL